MFKSIVIVYCLVGLFLNVVLLPRKNKVIYEQNEYILERYRQMERVLNKMEEKEILKYKANCCDCEYTYDD